MVVQKKQDELIWKKRTTREQWINWFYWLIGISIVLFAWKIISDKMFNILLIEFLMDGTACIFLIKSAEFLFV